MNWHDAQKRTAGFHMAPPVTVAPMVPVQNPSVCERYDLGATLMASAAEMQASQQWFQANVALYVLNLPRDVERKQFMTSRLAELGLQAEFVPGVDMTVPGTYARLKQDGTIPEAFDAQRAQQAMNGVGGMIGCASAHLRTMQQIASAGKPQQLAVVLEDDVRLEDDFTLKLQRLVTGEAPCDWQVISLKSACPFGVCVTPHLTRVQPDINEPADRCRHGVNYGFYGMLYRVETLNAVRQTLSRRVWDASAPHCLDVDVALASISDQVAYYGVPYWQAPGFLQMGGHGSSRNTIDKAQVDLTEPSGAGAGAAAGAAGVAPAAGAAPAASGAAPAYGAAPGTGATPAYGADPAVGAAPGYGTAPETGAAPAYGAAATTGASYVDPNAGTPPGASYVDPSATAQYTG